MAKITVPVTSAQNGGNLYALIDDLTNLNSQVTRIRDNGSLVIDDTEADGFQKLNTDQVQLLEILAETGELEEHLMGIHGNNTLANTLVPVGLPIRTNALGDVKVFKDWFLPGSELWTEDAGTGIAFLTNPAAGLSAPSDYLTGSQMEIIRQLDVVNYSILTVDELTALTASGWTKVDWEAL